MGVGVFGRGLEPRNRFRVKVRVRVRVRVITVRVRVRVRVRVSSGLVVSQHINSGTYLDEEMKLTIATKVNLCPPWCEASQ